MPVGEGPACQKISFYIIKRPFDPCLSVGVVNPMRPKMDAVNSGKGLHFRGKRSIWACAVADNNAGIVDNAASTGALHIRYGLGQEGFAFKPGEPRVVLDEKLTAVGQGKAGTLGRKRTVADFQFMR